MHDYQNDPEFKEMMENAQAEAKSTMRMLASVMVVLMGVLVGLLVYLLMRWWYKKLFIDVTKKQLKAQAAAYKSAYNSILESYAPWKRNAVLEDLNKKSNNGFVIEFAKAVIALAESSEVVDNMHKVIPSKKRVVKAKVSDSLDKKI